MNDHPLSPGGSLCAHPAEDLAGTVTVPGDKSISHRALMLGALAVGETKISGLLDGEDVLATVGAMRALGADIERDSDGVWHVWGCGVGGLREPDNVIDLGNSGTGVRLLMGLAAGHPFTTILTGDGSLRRRPMGRIARPLEEMGAVFLGRAGDRLPMSVTGRGMLLPITYETPVASAQIKSAVLLAGLHAPGVTSVIEKHSSRDHTERMLRALRRRGRGRGARRRCHGDFRHRPAGAPGDRYCRAGRSIFGRLSTGCGRPVARRGRDGDRRRRQPAAHRPSDDALGDGRRPHPCQ